MLIFFCMNRLYYRRFSSVTKSVCVRTSMCAALQHPAHEGSRASGRFVGPLFNGIVRVLRSALGLWLHDCVSHADLLIVQAARLFQSGATQAAPHNLHFSHLSEIA